MKPACKSCTQEHEHVAGSIRPLKTNYVRMKYCILIFSLCFSFTILAQKIDDRVYEFPTRPGLADWSNFKTENERFSALQIPDNLLKSMSTESLIITCINYPAFGHYTAFNSLQYGMDHLIKNFNGLQELLKRDGAPVKLLSIYSKINSTTTSIKEIVTDFWSIRSCYFELLLAQEKIIDKMTKEERIAFIQEASRKLKEKIKSEEEISFFSIQSTLLIIGRVLDKCEYAKFQEVKVKNADIDFFLKTGNLNNLSLLNDLIEITDGFVKNK
jgi:hypothetical protein